ncbi:hypothetical protein [Actinokineospora cianjurensis]|uniref:Uncharacterized protein n=1 Tax=Actinokineospora cianjurensis TaxID=585224 RepID=A0A421AZY9_9PSEU|nr:hypothetical protein [Actinokineospora cianjurensis]RLK55334.1 hypothetical protein CLV68_4819 [Actinokineospora cianjurensis]
MVVRVVSAVLVLASVVLYAVHDLGRGLVYGAAVATFALGLAYPRLSAVPRSTLVREVHVRAAMAMTPAVVVVLVWPAAAVVTFAKAPTTAGVGFLVAVFCLTGFGLARLGGRVAEWRLPRLTRRGPWHRVPATLDPRPTDSGDLTTATATLTLPDGTALHATLTAVPTPLVDHLNNTGHIWLAGPPAPLTALGYPDHSLVAVARLKSGTPAHT